MKRVHVYWLAIAVVAIVVANGSVFAAPPPPTDPGDVWEMTASEFEDLMKTGEWTVVSAWTDDDGVCHYTVIGTVGTGRAPRAVTVSPDG